MDNKYRCVLCNKNHASKSKLVCHLRVHTKEKPYVCSTCGKGFSQKSHLIPHLRTHTGDKPFACKLCNKRFTQSHHLQFHIMVIHLKQKNFNCEVCSKAFSSRHNLELHMKTGHVSRKEKAVKKPRGERPKRKNYICEICCHTFVNRTSLEKHIRIHTHETPHICEVCGKVFQMKSKFIVKHMQRHREQKTRVRKICNIVFNQKAAFVTHTNEHRKGLRSSCHVCIQAFSIKGDLVAHVEISKNQSAELENMHTNIKQLSCGEQTSTSHEEKQIENVQNDGCTGGKNLSSQKNLQSVEIASAVADVSCSDTFCDEGKCKQSTCWICRPEFSTMGDMLVNMSVDTNTNSTYSHLHGNDILKKRDAQHSFKENDIQC